MLDRRPHEQHPHYTDIPSFASEAGPNELRSVAEAYIAAGMSVFPLRLDGSKAPAVRTWNPYRRRFADRLELRTWYWQPAGIGLVCGKQSGGLEGLDFDERADETFSEWLDRLPPAIRGQLCVVQTGGLGYHVLYRCAQVCGNVKIAMTAAGGVLIESRGEGGYVVAAGSPHEVHASGNPYMQVMGRPLPEVPVFAPEQRKALWDAAAALDERGNAMDEYIRKRAAELRPSQPADLSTPWDDYDLRGTWDAILIPAGWTTGDGVTWTRPGKTFGTSAKVCTAANGMEVLTVFSGNAGPLAPEGMGHRTWGKFGAFAALHCAGDRRQAARAARAMGYGRAGQ